MALYRGLVFGLAVLGPGVADRRALRLIPPHNKPQPRPRQEARPGLQIEEIVP